MRASAVVAVGVLGASTACALPSASKSESETPMAMIERQRAEKERRREEESVREKKRVADKQAERSERDARAKAEKERIDKEAFEAEKARCASSRAERLAQLQEEVREHQAFQKKNRPLIEWAAKHCEVFDSRGVLVTRERAQGGVVVRTRAVGAENDVKCDTNTGRPKGIDAEWLASMQEYAATKDEPLGESVGRTCFPHDEAAVGGPLVVAKQDVDGQAKILGLSAK
jgi:hypothetical protein